MFRPSSSTLNMLGTALTVLTLVFAVGTFTVPYESLSIALAFVILAVEIAAIVCFYLARASKTN